jgi:hypothetical protein
MCENYLMGFIQRDNQKQNHLSILTGDSCGHLFKKNKKICRQNNLVISMVVFHN